MARLLVTAYQAQAAEPAKRYGQRAKLLVQSLLGTVHARASISADIPENAVVTQADLVFSVAETWAGSKTLQVKRQTSAFDNTITWNTRPATAGTAVQVTASDPAVRTKLTFNVLDDVQAFIAGSLPNYGWQLFTGSAATPAYVLGSTSALGVPYLDLVWVFPGEPPTDLQPHGTIATGQPVLQFLAAEDTTHVQVQVDSTDDFASPLYDSGQVVATGNIFSLAGTGYTILNGETRYWRVRAWAGGVQSDWSEAAEITRTNLPALTITAPGATTGSPTPKLEWTFANQTAWQARLYDDELGRYVADSGFTAGTVKEWIPDVGLRGEGDGTFELQTWDDVLDRVPTSGVPEYAAAVKAFTVNVGGLDDGPTDVTLTQRGGTPIIDVTWTFAVAPTKLVVQRAADGGPFRDVSPEIAGTNTQWADRTAPRNHNLVYRVLPIDATGTRSATGPTELIYPSSRGVWLLDPEAAYADTAAVVLLGKEQGTATMVEQAVVHTVNNRAAVRRRIGLVPPSGGVSGPLMSALGVTAAEGLALLMAWKKEDAGKVFRLVIGDWNLPVTVGDIQAFPEPNATSADALYGAEFAWWQTDEELPW